ncbi:MAG: hypothetical protein IIY07_06330, partial [Thermoguttaceae bacterium]|nr:hypothetical protein [Thermoguttaceae bacterium]
MMPLENSDAPFVFHGTPLPTQILLYGELINKTCDKALAKKFPVSPFFFQFNVANVPPSTGKIAGIAKTAPSRRRRKRLFAFPAPPFRRRRAEPFATRR